MILQVLLNGLWQGASVVAAAYGLCRIIGPSSATTRYALWFVALVAILALPVAVALSDAGARIVAAFTPHFTAGSYSVTLLPAGRDATHARSWLEKAAPWVVFAWLLGVGFNLARLGVSFIRVERIGRRAQPLPAVARDVYVSGDVEVPIVAGIIAPRIVLPADLIRLSEATLRQIAAHERAHVVRKDPLYNLVQRTIEALLFFNPWIRIAGAAVTSEREAACDDWVVHSGNSAEDYAGCLATLAQRLRAPRVPLLGAGAYRSRHAIVQRIERLQVGGPRRVTVNAYAFGGIIVLFIAVTLALQAFSPVVAATPASGSLTLAPESSRLLAATCAHPNADAKILTAAPPSLPHGLKASGKVNVLVTIAPTGHVTGTKVTRSSGNASIDNAVAEAARKSTYSPKVANCEPVEGQYVFQAQFAPSP